MWRKLLKYTEFAKCLYRVEVKNGQKASFWHETWSPLGCLRDILREGSYIDMGIPLNATVDASRMHRRRHHRVVILNKVEDEIEKYRAIFVNE